MSRPFLLIGFTYLFSLIFAFCFSVTVCFILSVVLLMMFLSIILSKKASKLRVFVVALLVASMAFGVYGLMCLRVVEPKKGLDGKEVSVTGLICEIPYESYGRLYYVLNTPDYGKVRISTQEALEADVYDEVSCIAHLFVPQDKGLFSKLSFNLAKGIYATGYIVKDSNVFVEKLVSPIRHPYYYALKSRMAITQSIRILLPQKLSSVANGILMGDTYDIDDMVKSNFRELGISHLLAVSGLHMSVITQMMIFILTRLKINKKASALISSFGAFVFMAVTGFSPSVVRAGIMAIVYILGVFFYRESDSLNSLGLAVFIILLLNPFAAGDIGLLLSFFATLGILLFSRWFESRIRLPFNLSSTVAVTLSATVLTLPVLMLSFKRFSLISVVANILVVLPALVMMPMILCAAILAFIPPLMIVAKVIAYIAGLLIKYVIWCASFLSKSPITSISIADSFLLFWLMGTFVIFALAIVFSCYTGNKARERYMLRISSILSVILLLTGVLSSQVASKDKITLAILDVGNGESIVLSKNGHAAMLSCGGDEIKKRVVMNYIDQAHVKSVDLMMIPGAFDSVCSYADDILYEYKPYNVLLSRDDKFDNKVTQDLFPECGTYYIDEKVDTQLFGTIKMRAVVIAKKIFIKLVINETKVVVCPECNSLCDLPSDFKVCDFLITTKVPKHMENINASHVVLSGDLKSVTSQLRDVALCDVVPFVTAGDGSILLDFHTDNSVSIKKQ